MEKAQPATPKNQSTKTLLKEDSVSLHSIISEMIDSQPSKCDYKLEDMIQKLMKKIKNK